MPFNQNGNSHKKSSNFNFSYHNIGGYENDIDIDCDIIFGHPKTKPETNISSIIDKILLTDRKIIFLNCTDSSILLNINNKFTKIWEDGWLTHTQSGQYCNKLFGNHTNDLENCERWEQREFLSFYIFKQHESESGYKNILNFKNLLFIPIENLINDFESIIRNIFSFINIEIKRTNFEEIHSEWIRLQYYKNSDNITKEILSAILNDKFLDWSDKNLSIIDEAWIQNQLREYHGIEIRCWNLNNFPTNTISLKPYLYYQNT